MFNGNSSYLFKYVKLNYGLVCIQFKITKWKEKPKNKKRVGGKSVVKRGGGGGERDQVQPTRVQRVGRPSVSTPVRMGFFPHVLHNTIHLQPSLLCGE